MAKVEQTIDQLVANARKAADIMKHFTQEQVDKITAAMDAASVANEVKLAEMAVAETGIGRADHKAIKNHLGAHVVYEYFKDKKSVGVIEEKEGVRYVAEPFGVLAAATPTTNPTSTVMFKSLISLKTRNAIIFAAHPRAQKCSVEAAKIMLDAAVSAGAPANCIQWIDEPSIEGNQHPLQAPGRESDPGHRRRRHGQVRIQLRSPGHRRRSGQYARISSPSPPSSASRSITSFCPKPSTTAPSAPPTSP